MLSDEWLSRYGLLENFNASVTRTRTRTGTGTGTWTTGVTAIALCTSCSRANKKPIYGTRSDKRGLMAEKKIKITILTKFVFSISLKSEEITFTNGKDVNVERCAVDAR